MRTAVASRLPKHSQTCDGSEHSTCTENTNRPTQGRNFTYAEPGADESLKKNTVFPLGITV
ncbi:hypothetical protein SV7mr_05280 [Stieleria bergensis]|uniref:Uncharacterized protein n=1 Tax=Stieleria bergensis TaxID=2528025 RepID=A0A517SPK5_9BACT|nr:hypothetical protein SV7mr_05280 [Planctomycetes bacterium SV_7m_r]